MAKGRTAAEHYTQAQSNEAFYRQIGGSGSNTPDWAVTALFYTVVHEVEAMFRMLNLPGSADHHERKGRLRRISTQLAKDYETIERMSRHARYECVKHNQMHIALAEARLPFIRQEIQNKVGPPSGY